MNKPNISVNKLGITYDLPLSERLDLLHAWKNSWEHIRVNERALDVVIRFSESRFMEDINRMFILYTDTLGKIIGDTKQWMKWYWEECDMGNEPKQVIFPDHETIVVSTIEDLLIVIERV